MRRHCCLPRLGVVEPEPEPVLTAGQLISMQRLVRQMPVGDSVVEAILDLVRSARPDSPEASDEVKAHVRWGPGPRAAQALMLATRARALVNGRLSPSIDDVIALAENVLVHRMALGFAARTSGLTVADLISSLVKPLEPGGRAPCGFQG